MVDEFLGPRRQPGYPKCILRAFGTRLEFNEHIGLEKYNYSNNQLSFTLKNISNEPIKIEKVKVGDVEKSIQKVLFPSEGVELSFQSNTSEPAIRIEYEICREADVLWPFSKAVVIGLGDYPPSLLSEILSLSFIRK